VQYEIEVGGRTRHVSVTREGARFAVSLDGRTFHVDAARIDGQTLSLLVDGAWCGDTAQRGYEVVVTPDAAGESLAVHVGQTPIAVAMNGRRSRRRDEGGHAGAGPQTVTAPMSGKVVRVLVAAGDHVVPRQPLLVVEAMKMENELRAGRAGTIAEIRAREGQSVDAGALLVVIQ
jgi:biotin carboxyl carrier protein